ncbi:MAG: hypothetical protein K8S56_08370 [Candidatus Cloacimonetes bacterium]|nr:hypothetical protein [Candidatus Cloacimonadota bacterium]
MKLILRIAIACLIVMILVACSKPSQMSTVDELPEKAGILWSKATVIAAENWNRVPGRSDIHLEMKDTQKQDAINLNLTLSHTLTDSGKISNKIINSEEAFNDLQNDLFGLLKSQIEQDRTPQNISLFHNNSPNNPLVSFTGKTKRINGYLCLGFDFEYKMSVSDSVAQKGTVWLEKKSGAPIFKESSMEVPIPMIPKLKMTETYSFVNDVWTNKEITLSAEMNILTQKVSFTMQLKQSAWWIYSP